MGGLGRIFTEHQSSTNRCAPNNPNGLDQSLWMAPAREWVESTQHITGLGTQVRQNRWMERGRE